MSIVHNGMGGETRSPAMMVKFDLALIFTTYDIYMRIRKEFLVVLFHFSGGLFDILTVTRIRDRDVKNTLLYYSTTAKPPYSSTYSSENLVLRAQPALPVTTTRNA